jgi:AbrB family looped-hinge helix DNA binding protein
MTKTTISPNGEVVIPEVVRQRLNLKAGAQLSIDVQGEAIVMKPLAEIYPDWRTMEGMAKGGESLTKALMEERAAELAHDEARAKGC